jgi:hypothetical protein
MEEKKKRQKLTWKTGLTIYALCWAATFGAVYLLRQALIPREELDCYARIRVLQKAVDQWDSAHPDQPVTEEIDQQALVKAGFLKPLVYDHDKHYYFVGKTAHGLRVKCNKHADNPLALKLTGDTLLAVLLFIVICAWRGYVLFEPS